MRCPEIQCLSESTAVLERRLEGSLQQQQQSDSQIMMDLDHPTRPIRSAAETQSIHREAALAASHAVVAATLENLKGEIQSALSNDLDWTDISRALGTVEHEVSRIKRASEEVRFAIARHEYAGGRLQ